MTSSERTRVLNDIAIVAMGQSPKGETCNSDGIGVPLLNGPTEFGFRNPSPVQYTTDPTRLAEPGDLLFCVRGSTTGRMNWADQVYAIGRGIASIRGKDGYPTSYVRAVIEDQLDSLLMRATGSTFPNVSRRMLTELPVPDHDASTAAAIADILDVLEHRAWNLVQVNSTLESIAETTFQSWFIDFDPVHAKAVGEQPMGMDEETAALFPSKFVDSELGPIPKGWRIQRVRDLCVRIANGSTPSRRNVSYWENGTIPWYKTGDLLDGFLTHPEERITPAALDHTSVKLFPRHSVIMAIYAAPTVGRLGILTGQSTFNQACTGLIAEPGVGPWFLYQTLFHGREWFNNRANGAAQQNISKAIVESYPCVVPPGELLKAYNSLVEPLYAAIENNTFRITTLVDLRDTLLPRLISGKLRIPEAEALVEEAVS